MQYSIENIIQKNSASIFKICLGYAKSIQEAEDLVQEVYINIWKGLQSFKGASDIKTWIYRITVNTCLLQLRKKRLPTVSLTDIENQEHFFLKENKQLDESFQQLHEFIQQLEGKEKLIMLLYLEDLSHKEIANIIGITSNYVGVKINRIKKLLKNKFNTNG